MRFMSVNIAQDYTITESLVESVGLANKVIVVFVFFNIASCSFLDDYFLSTFDIYYLYLIWDINCTQFRFYLKFNFQFQHGEQKRTFFSFVTLWKVWYGIQNDMLSFRCRLLNWTHALQMVCNVSIWMVKFSLKMMTWNLT